MSKWEQPSDWLEEWIETASTNELRQIASSMAGHISQHDILDVFEAEMENSGYFEKPVPE